MAKIKKNRETDNTDVIDIQEIAKLYQTYVNEEKAAKKSAEEHKKLLLDFASNNREMFEGNKLQFECGTYIELRRKLQQQHDPIEDLAWVKDMVEMGAGDGLEIKINAQAMMPLLEKSPQIRQKLNEIKYAFYEVEQLAVYAK